MLNKMKELWLEHLRENRMSYCQHLRFAAMSATVAIVHCVRLLIHAVMPCFNRSALRDIHAYTCHRRSIKGPQKVQPREGWDKAFADIANEE